MTAYDIYAAGNGIVDILLEVSDEEFSKLGFSRGRMDLVSPEEQNQLLDQFAEHPKRLASGGSIANSLALFQQLGGTCAFTTSIADDEYGKHFQAEFENLGISLGGETKVGAHTGTCVVLVTPDAERTMRTSLAISGDIANADIDPKFLARVCRI